MKHGVLEDNLLVLEVLWGELSSRNLEGTRDLPDVPVAGRPPGKQPE